VFNMKLNALFKDLLQNGVLGTTVTDIHVVEWQKRGLPHGHILIILRSQDKPRDSSDYDRIVCAELPDKSTHPELYNIVTFRMLHGPCGALHPSCPCMVNGMGLAARVIPRLFSPKLRTPPAATQPTGDGTTTGPSPTPCKCKCWKFGK
jgi:hypothetical protein